MIQADVQRRFAHFTASALILTAVPCQTLAHPDQLGNKKTVEEPFVALQP